MTPYSTQLATPQEGEEVMTTILNHPARDVMTYGSCAIALPLLIPFTFLHNHHLTTVLNHSARDAMTYGSCAIALPLLIPFTFLHNHHLTTVLNHSARDAMTYGSCAISYATAVGDRKPL
ncbi:MAG: hypothetical protein F6K31_08335 [Symploca sp. SIO2G7]|nr:hypothetical protein [Symploca sp. SIO2G7]